MTTETVRAPTTFPWTRRRHRIVRTLRIASVVSNIRSWMRDVGAGWLMTSLAPRPMMVALVQAVATAPLFLEAAPAGALAATVDRRRDLMSSQVWMMITAATLGVLTLWGTTTALTLSIFFFRAEHWHGTEDARRGARLHRN
jgi:transmembrane secretion effector